MQTPQTLSPLARRPPHGFTLLEVLLASAIFAVVMIAVYTMYAGNQALFARGERASDTQQNARAALDLLTRELRMAGYLDDSTPQPNSNPRRSPNPIVIAKNTVLVIKGNVLGLASSGGSKDYFYGVQTGTTATCPTPPCLLRGELTLGTSTYTLEGANGSWQVIAYNIQSVNFTYFDANNNKLDPAANNPPALDSVDVGGANPNLNPYTQRGGVQRIELTLNAADSRGIPYGGNPPAYVLWADINVRNQEDPTRGFQ